MKLTSLETKTGASKGAFLHLRHPALGHYLYTGEGADEVGRAVDRSKAEKVGCDVLGMESERVREKAREIQRRKLKDPEDSEAEAQGLEFVASLVTGFHGITGEDDKPLPATAEGKRTFFEQSDDLVNQVMKFAGDRANFWKGGSAS